VTSFAALRTVILLALLSTTACTNGFVYRHTTQPLSRDFRQTPVVHGEPARNDLKQFRYRYLDFRWESNSIGDIARKAGVETIYYADVETLSILGVWTQTWVLVYGCSGDSCESPAPR